MTNKEYRVEPASTLSDVGVKLQQGFDDGYRVSEGWPIQIGWIYEVKMERDAVVEEKRAVGRPKVDKQKEV